MMILGKPFNEFQASDIERLVNERVPESKTLEYKQSLPDNSPEQRRKFLAGVSAFANAVGGVVVYGITEERGQEGESLGVPGRVRGLSDFNFDQTKLHLENILRSGLKPPLSSVGFHSIEVDGQPILLLGIGRSLFAPHMVCYDGDSRFWTRTNSGKAQMSVEELRQSFLEISSWEVEAERFRNERIANFGGTRIPAGLQVISPMILHLVPLGRRGNFLQLNLFAEDAQRVGSSILKDSIHGLFNIDGYLLHPPGERKYSYLHFFRNGCVEYYACAFIQQAQGIDALNGFVYELRIHDALEGLIPILLSRDVGFPFAIFLSILNANKLPLLPANNEYWDGWQGIRIGVETLLLPGLVVEQAGRIPEMLKPTFDFLWQSAGMPECPGYDLRLEKRRSKVK